MGTCLNVLEDTQGFLLVATLIVLVSLVRVQLYASGRGRRQDENVNWVAGLVWTYLALSFALVAVALFVCEKSACDKGFLIWSFLMTGVSILTAILQNVIRIFREGSIVGTGNSRCERIRWSVWWVFLGFGLGILSFGYVLNCACPYEWFSYTLVIITVLYAFLRLVLACWPRAQMWWWLHEARGGTARRWLIILY
jgi:hypothetical protein